MLELEKPMVPTVRRAMIIYVFIGTLKKTIEQFKH